MLVERDGRERKKLKMTPGFLSLCIYQMLTDKYIGPDTLLGTEDAMMRKIRGADLTFWWRRQAVIK